MSQVKIDFLVTGNMSSLHKQVQTLNAQLMAVAGSMTAVGRSMSNVDLQSANAQFGRMMTTSGQFTQQMVTMKTHTDTFSDSLGRQRLSLGQAYNETKRYITRRESLIGSLARQQVRMQNSVVMPQGVGTDGKVTARVLTPTGLDPGFATQMRVANKGWEIFNATAQQGATQMVNWGKNTQWAGRQLMVGFTVPLMMAGGLAAKTFKELDEELVRLQKVYGTGFSFGDDFKKQSAVVREAGIEMAKDMAKAYGQAGTETVGLMADLAAIGLEGEELAKMTEQTTKLSVLGEVDRQESMKATVAMQSAFKMSTDEVADSVLFLNAVENATSATLNDLVEAIPRAGTVVHGLGGDMEDLALYMVAMREGGISAAEGANALKSGLSSVIAPPKASVEFLKEMGINLPKIVKSNAGDLTGTLVELQGALGSLDDLSRQQAITTLFGKYQFARMSAFFENLGARGSQTQSVFDLMNTSVEDLAKTADQELGAIADSTTGKWERAWESFKVNISEIGESVLVLGTKLLSVFNKVFGFISDNPALMSLVKYLGLAAAAIGPVIMVMGLFGNMIGMILKGVLRLANGFRVLTSGGGIAKTFEMLTAESFQADNAVDQLTGSMYNQKSAQEVLTRAVHEYTLALQALQGQSRATKAAVAATTMGGPVNFGALAKGAKTQGGIGFFAGDYGSNDALRQNPRTPAAMASMPNADKKLLAQATVLDLVAAESGGGKYLKSTTNLTESVQELDRAAQQVQVLGAAGKDTSAALARQEMAQEKVNEATRVATQGLISNEEAQRRAALVRTEAGRRQQAAENAARELRYNAQGRFQGKSAQHLPVMKGFNYAASIKQGLFDPAEPRKIMSLVSNDMADFGNKARDAGAVFEHITPSSWDLQKRIKYIASELNEAGAATQFYASEMIQAAAAGQGIELNEAELAAATDLLVGSRQRQLSAEKALYDKIVAQTAALNASVPGTNKINTAFNNAAIEAGDTAVSMQTVEIANRRYVAMINASGEVLQGTAFSINKAGAVTPIDTDDFQRAVNAAGDAADGASVSTKKLATAEEVAAAATMDSSAADVIDESSTRRNTMATDINTKAELTNAVANDLDAASEYRNVAANDADSASEYRNVAANDADSASEYRNAAANNAAAAGTAGSAGAPGGFMNYVKNNKSMMAGGALMGGAMMGSMLLPEGPASNVANLTMMGAGVGGMFGPWGLAIGGVAGLVGGSLMEAFKASSEEAKKQAEIAAAAWEGRFSDLELGDEIAKSLGLKNLKEPVTIDITGMAKGKPQSQQEYEAFKASVAEQYGPLMEDLKLISESGESEEYIRMEMEAALARVYAGQVAKGASTEEMSKIVTEIAQQSGVSEIPITLIPQLETEAGSVKKAQGYLQGIWSESLTTATLGVQDQIIDSVVDYDKMDAASAALGQAYADNFVTSVQTGIIKTPRDVFIGIRTATKNLIGDMEMASFDISETLAAGIETEIVGSSYREGISSVFYGDTSLDIIKKYMEANEDDREGVLRILNRVNSVEAEELSGALQKWDGAFSSFKSEMFALYPTVEGFYTKLRNNNSALSQQEALLRAVTRAQAQYNREQRAAEFMSGLNEILTPMIGTEKTVNLEKMARQQERELEQMQEHEEDKLEALQEAEDERLEQMQEAAEKRERAIEREINQLEREYDKQIRAIENVEAKRQEAFENEQERAQRREEMRNLEISYEEAIANGDLYEAARIRMDIAGIKKQRDAETKEEKRQEKADKKIKRLEKERNQKIRILNQELRAEQKANEKAIESAQEASAAKIEAAQEASEARIKAEERANRIALKDQKVLNREIEEAKERSLKLQEKMLKAFLNNNHDSFKKYADELGISSGKATAAIAKLVEKEFGYLPDGIRDALVKSIKSGNWQSLKELMEMAVQGASRKEINKYFNPQGFTTEPVTPDTRRKAASGGYISGPGTGTSDSIPARLSNGEYVVRQRSVSKYGKGAMDAVNAGNAAIIPGLAEGGIVGPIMQGIMQPPAAMLSKIIDKALVKSSGGTTATPGEPGKYSGTFFNAEQLKNAAIIAGVGKSMGANKRDILTALATAMTESTLHNYKKAVDHDSLGLFQQRPSMGWGTPEQLTDPKYASRKFYQALFGISNRDQMSIGDAAQDVQVSAYPDRYQEWVDEARAILKSISYKDKYVKPWMGSHGYSRTFGQHGGEGVDISMPTGTPLRAVTGGRLTNQPFAFGSYGHWYTLDNDGLQFVYAHLDRDKAGSGPVSPGDIIGYSGNTGKSFGAHLHFEARRNGLFSDQIDPARLGIPGLRSGGRINYDNTLANLHRGETVLTRQLSDKFENNVASAGNNTYNFNVDKIELHKELDLEREFSRFVVKHERRQEQRTGRGRRV